MSFSLFQCLRLNWVMRRRFLIVFLVLVNANSYQISSQHLYPFVETYFEEALFFLDCRCKSSKFPAKWLGLSSLFQHVQCEETGLIAHLVNESWTCKAVFSGSFHWTSTNSVRCSWLMHRGIVFHLGLPPIEDKYGQEQFQNFRLMLLLKQWWKIQTCVGHI